MYVKYIYVLLNKAQLNKDVNSKVNFQKNVDSIVYVFLKIFGWSSDETNTCDFTGFCRMVYSKAMAFMYDLSALSAST